MLLAAAAAIAVLAAGVERTSEVQLSAGGHALGEVVAAGPTVRYVRTLGGPELALYQEDASRWDMATALLLAVAAGAAWLAFLLQPRPAPSPGRTRLLLACMAAGFGWLGADELLSVHETIGYNAKWLADLPAFQRPDDVIIAAYFLLAAAFSWSFRAELRSSARALPWFASALGAAGLGVVLDVATSVDLENRVELVASALLTAGTLIFARDAVRAPAQRLA